MGYELESEYYYSEKKNWKKDTNSNMDIHYFDSKSSYNIIDPSDLMRSRSLSQKHCTSSSKSPPPNSNNFHFHRSFSQKPTKSLYRSSSMKMTSPAKCNLVRSFSKKSSAFGKKCTHLAKDQKARFYIIKRCVSMLLSSRKNSDS